MKGPRYILLTETVQNFSAGTTVAQELKLKAGYRYHGIEQLLFSGVNQRVADGFDKVRLLIDDRPQRDRLVTLQDAFNVQYGEQFGLQNDIPGVAGEYAALFHEFQQEWRPIIASREKFALDVLDLSNLKNIGIANGVTNVVKLETTPLAAATAPAARYRALVTPLDEIDPSRWNLARNNDGSILVQDNKVRPVLEQYVTRGIEVSGDSKEFFDIVPRAGYTMLAFRDPAESLTTAPNRTIEFITVKVGNDVIVDRMSRQDIELMNLRRGIAPVADHVVIHPDVSDRLDQFWDLRDERVEIKLEFSGSVTAGSQVFLSSSFWGRAS